MFYVDGPGGTGKTYLYNCILSNLKRQDMASTLLLHGTTVHRAFQLPIELHEDTVAGCKLSDARCDIIRRCSLIVWDEAPMSPKMALHAVDRFLKDVMNNNMDMGGKVLLMGGDFRQVLPVLKRGKRTNFINASIKCSYLWPRMQQRQLTNNIRLLEDEVDFGRWLLHLGGGSLPPATVDDVQLQDSIVVPQDMLVHTVDQLVNAVYGEELDQDPSFRAILCPTNKQVDSINYRILDRLEVETKTYLNSDTVQTGPNYEYQVTTEFLNSIKDASLPPHTLKLKIGCIMGGLLGLTYIIHPTKGKGCSHLVRMHSTSIKSISMP